MRQAGSPTLAIGLRINPYECCCSGHFAGYLGQPCRGYPREEAQELLRRRASDTQEVEDGTPGYRAMLHLVRGVRRDAQRQGAQERRASPIAVEEMDTASQSVRSPRTEGFRRQA